jgi:hypothetical protein
MFMTATKSADHYRASIVRKRARETGAAIVVLALCMSSLAQQLARSPVQELAPGIISTGRGFTVTFSPDGHDAYFTARDGSGVAAKPPVHVYHSHFDQSRWQPAKAVAFSSAQWSDLDPFITVDGQRMFFISTRPAPDKDPSKRDMDIWYSERKNGDWDEPHWIAEVNSDAKEGSPSLDRQNNLYFFSDRSNQPDQNSIYVARCATDTSQLPRSCRRKTTAGKSTPDLRIPVPGSPRMARHFCSTQPVRVDTARLISTSAS